MQTGEPFDCEPQPLLARDTARYAGQPVAFVTGRTPDEALDAADRVQIAYDALDPEAGTGSASTGGPATPKPWMRRSPAPPTGSGSRC